MIHLTFIGHSAWIVRHDKFTLMVDPFIEGNPVATIRRSDVKPQFIIVTHAHGDHLGDAVPLSKTNGATIIANFEIANYCESAGARAHAMHIGGSHSFPFGRVKLTPAWHGSSFPDGGYGGTPTGAVISIGGRTIYHTGDTGLFSDMKLVGDMGIDLMLVPIGDNFTMGPDDAVRAVEFVRPRRVVPMHYGTWDVIATDPKKFVDAVKAMKIKVDVLKPGETMELS
jgi:L-ascorbate metabolism protein UlaG (beta-lactamase superfamily)